MAQHHKHHRHPKLAKPHKKLHLQAAHPNVDIEVDMGDGPATPSAGYAGWEEISRLQRRSLTAFKGLPAFQQDVPILIDGFREDRAIDRQVEEVLSLGGRVIFTAEGPIYHSGGRFVFGDEPEFTEQIRDTDESLLRVRMVLKLMKWVPLDAEPSKRGRDTDPSRSFQPEYTVTAGANTLSQICHLLYPGENSRWKEIGKKNGITDPHRKLQTGRRIVL